MKMGWVTVFAFVQTQGRGPHYSVPGQRPCFYKEGGGFSPTGGCVCPLASAAAVCLFLIVLYLR